MIMIKGTNKIKGALDLSGIKLQLQIGTNILITEDQFHDHTVQAALRMGYLTYERGETFDPDAQPKLVNCKNIYDRPLSINCLNSEIRPGQSFVLTDVQLNNSDIRSALAKGYISIVSSAKTQDVDETEVEIGDLLTEEDVQKKDIDDTTEQSDELETNEELSNPKVINTETPDPVKKNDIPDPKGKTVVWNPNKDPVVHTKTSMKAVGKDRTGKDTKNINLETNVELDDMKFVDKELDERRVSEHPVLKNKEQGDSTDGIDFL